MSRITIVIEDAGTEVVFSRREDGDMGAAWQLASQVCDRIDELGAIEVEPEECECEERGEVANA